MIEGERSQGRGPDLAGSTPAASVGAGCLSLRLHARLSHATTPSLESIDSDLEGKPAVSIWQHAVDGGLQIPLRLLACDIRSDCANLPGSPSKGAPQEVRGTCSPARRFTAHHGDERPQKNMVRRAPAVTFEG